jgi:ankyrin repeat protein
MDGPPLHVACHLGNWSIAQGLLQAGVDPNLVGSSQRQRLMGATPAHAVAAGFRSQRKDAYANCLSVLIQAGGDLDKLDMKKRSPIDYAMESAAATGDRTLVDAMLDYGVDTLTNSKSALSAHSIGISMATVRPNKRKAETDLPSRMIKSHLTTMTRKVMP